MNNDEIVYQKDLGPDSLNIVKNMDLYNPDPTWHPTNDPWPARDRRLPSLPKASHNNVHVLLERGWDVNERKIRSPASRSSRNVRTYQGEMLNPPSTWADKSAYDATAGKLAELFRRNFAAFESGVSAEIRAAGASR